ncbi:methionyl-tRNA formyltransferase [Croceitalea sp. MTPC9]|uniref:methionyl-tRNA formyltransferase n=1 Tax=unclassified Croceitalea TaxID=2632280 RepID=UPI002B3D4A09|nr:methionyl-tRNA formyltransferase [Croceitalea sp. MTPC6]GMN15946.1 methionyl-tRNA formyltransferase [Croceitalea sp. MTPC9]
MKESRDLRIVFMGTPEFAVAGLDKLVSKGYQVVGVITAPDRPAGRGRKLRKSAVKEYAKDNGITVLQPTNLKNEAFLEELKELKANLQVVVAFRMLPKVVWDMPKYGTFNLHASLLPQYRGAAPINWVIINGETKTGVTTFFIDEKIDTGEIILQESIGIGNSESAGELHDKLMDLGASLILKTVEKIARDDIELKKQTTSEDLKPAHKIHRETCEVDWSKPIHDIFNHIRGLSPYPTAWTTLYNDKDKLQLKIYKTEFEIEKHKHPIGKLISTKKTIKIAVENGYINLLEIQLPGKRKMKTHEVLNGLELSKNTYVR